MAHATDLPKDSFRLSQLIYDTRYRSLTIQVVVLILFAAFFSWLIGNTIDNLEAKGKSFSFAFLFSRAGYDINQQLVTYSSDSSHIRALVVGLLNTLLVASLGCIGATVVGVFVGVLRLSKNWLISRIMTVYVEIFRNIPLLLWILIIFVPLSELAPVPADFRIPADGSAPKASMLLNDSLAITARGINAPMPMFEHPLGSLALGPLSLNLTFLAIIAVIGVSLFINRSIRRSATARQEETGLRPTTWWQSLLILFAPIVLLLWALGFHMEYPELTRFNFKGGVEIQHSFTALLLALVLYTGAFIAEIVRAGILAISRGQSEAAFALGLRPSWTMNLIILPQALRVIIPPLISQFLNLTKNTSLGIAVSYLDLRGTLGGITLNQTGRELECMLLMMGIYLCLSLIISAAMNAYNKSVQIKVR